MLSNTRPMASGSGAAYSMNSKPSVPMGLSQAAVDVAAEGARGSGAFMGSLLPGWLAVVMSPL
ncbi:hypothetical protein D3C86_2148030 [compost metagenome]